MRLTLASMLERCESQNQSVCMHGRGARSSERMECELVPIVLQQPCKQMDGCAPCDPMQQLHASGHLVHLVRIYSGMTGTSPS